MDGIQVLFLQQTSYIYISNDIWKDKKLLIKFAGTLKCFILVPYYNQIETILR